MQSICDVSRKEFQALYDRLGVEVTERGESFYNAGIPSVLDELTGKAVAEVNDGALCIFPTDKKTGEVNKDKTPLICRKSDGGFNYASTDLTAMKQRLTEESADWLIYVTDAGQKQHFDGLFDATRRAGWLQVSSAAPRNPRRCVHIAVCSEAVPARW